MQISHSGGRVLLAGDISSDVLQSVGLADSPIHNRVFLGGELSEHQVHEPQKSDDRRAEIALAVSFRPHIWKIKGVNALV